MKSPFSRWPRIAALVAMIALSACERSDPNRESRGARTVTTNQFQITKSGIGPIKLGMTLQEARRALPKASFQRTSDGEGIPLVGVQLGSDSVMTLYADEEDASTPIDYSRKISYIETFSSRCMTAKGIKPGSLVSDVEKAYGKTEVITLSEIESRQFITFKNHPKGMTFRIDYTGIFADGSNETTHYDHEAKIFSIAVHQD